MAISGLDKINRALIFRTPATFRHLALSFINLNETARRQNRIHRQVFTANVTVGVVNLRQSFQIDKRDRSPLFDHAAKVQSLARIEAGIHPDRNLDGAGICQGM